MNQDLTQGKTQWVLLKFSLPLFGSIIFQQLYNIADSFVAGQYIGDDALAAVGNAYEVTLIYLAFAFGCNIGCSVVISQLFGAKEYRDVRTAVSTTLIASGVLCAVLMTAGFISIPHLLGLIQTPEGIWQDTLDYLNIYTAGLPFLFFYNIATGVFSALGDSRTPFCFLAVSSVVNIFMDILFVRSFHLAVPGVAWATFLCQSVSCICALTALFIRLHKLPAEGHVPHFSIPILRRITAVAVPSIFQQSFVSVGNIILQSEINGYGEAIIAGYSAAVKLQNFAVTSVSTLANGVSNFTAQNIGAKKERRVREGYRWGLVITGCTALLFTAAYLLFTNRLLGIFIASGHAESIGTGRAFLFTIAPFYLAIAVKLVSDSVLRGAGRMTPFMITTFTDLILRVVLALILSPRMGSEGIWLAWPIGWCISAVMSVLFYLTVRWQPSRNPVSEKSWTD